MTQSRAASAATPLPPQSRARGNLLPVGRSGGIGELMLFDEIGGSGMPGITAAMVREQMRALGDVKTLHCRINSDGGVVTEGMAIYTAIRQFSGRKVGYVEGIAASMASVILQAFDERHVAKGSYVMIHNPSGGARGESDDLKKAADLLAKMREEMLDIYEARTGLARDKITALMDAETWMTAEEAVELGFADVVDSDEAKARMELQAVARLSATAKNLPESLRALANQGKSKMTEEEMKAKIKALEDENAKLKAEKEGDKPEHDKASDDEDDKDKPKDEEDDSDDGEEDEEDAKAIAGAARLLTGKKSASSVVATLLAYKTKGVTTGGPGRAERVSALIREGKLAPVAKEFALSLSDKHFAAYERTIGQTKGLPMGSTHKEPKAPAPESDELTADEKAMMKVLGKDKVHMLALRKVKPNFAGVKKDD